MAIVRTESSERVGRSRGAGVDGVGPRRRKAPTSASLPLQLVAQRRDLGAGGVGGVGTEDQRTAGVADEGDAPTTWCRLAVEQQPDVDQLLHRPRPDDPGVGEQGVDGADVARLRRSVRSGAAQARTPTSRP